MIHQVKNKLRCGKVKWKRGEFFPPSFSNSVFTCCMDFQQQTDSSNKQKVKSTFQPTTRFSPKIYRFLSIGLRLSNDSTLPPSVLKDKQSRTFTVMTLDAPRICYISGKVYTFSRRGILVFEVTVFFGMVIPILGYSGMTKEPPFDVIVNSGERWRRITAAYVAHSVISACTIGRCKLGISWQD